MNGRGIFGYQTLDGYTWRVTRYYGRGAFDVVHTQLSRRDAERICERANRLLAQVRGTLARYLTP